MIGLSKSKYTKFCQCDKALWLTANKPKEEFIDEATKARFEQGNNVGDIAMPLLGNFIEVTEKKADGSLDLEKMIEKTKNLIEKEEENIAEASFSYDGNYCAVDILHKAIEGYEIYEVKSSTYSSNKIMSNYDRYIPDIAYQKWVLEKCGITVTGTYLVLLNSEYIMQNKLDIQQLFKKLDVAEQIKKEYDKVPERVANAKRVLEGREPDTAISANCNKPYKCGFWKYCTRNIITKASVFDLYRMNFSEKIELYEKNIVTFTDIHKRFQSDTMLKLSAIELMQIGYTLRGDEYIDKKGIREFLNGLSYPLYFLDFETMQCAIPQFKGTRPYQQIPFQYSLHFKESCNEEVQHKEFLGKSGTDPRRPLAERLCKDIPMNVCTLAYNKSFECTRIKELADTFPDLAKHLLNIRDHIQDLLEPFQKGYYYVPAMGGSFSIKSVLPALFPNKPALDYHKLDKSVQNGGNAMNIFPKIKDMAPEEAEKARKSLLEYCKLDTMAMVKVWEKMRKESR
jgi:hypothetical protein